MTKRTDITAIVQARMGSTRLPGKVLKQLGNVSLIEFLLQRLRQSKNIQKIIVAIPDLAKDDLLEKHLKELGYDIFRGNEMDVLSRYFHAATQFKAKNIVRVTGDCPLIDPGIVDLVIHKFRESSDDYTSNVCPPTFPDGLDVEVFTFAALEKAHFEVIEKTQREHVTSYFRQDNLFKKTNVTAERDWSRIKISVDTEADFNKIVRLCKYFGPRADFNWTDIKAYLLQHYDGADVNITKGDNE